MDSHKCGRQALRLFLGAGICLTVLTAGAIREARADIIVVGVDNVSGYKRGQVLRDGDIVKVPANGRIMVLLSSNAVREIKGPYESKVEELSKGRPTMVSRLWQLAMNYFQSGGSNVVAGGTRSVKVPGQPGAHKAAEGPKDFQALPVNFTGTFCASSSAAPKIWRPDVHGLSEVSLANVGANTVASTRFNPEEQEASWPATLTFASGTYMLTSGAYGVHKFELKVLDASAFTSELVLANLQAQGCEAQVEAWLKHAGEK